MKNMAFISVVKVILKAQSLKPQGLNLVKKGSFNEACLTHAFMASFWRSTKHAWACFFIFIFAKKDMNHEN